MCSSDLCIIHTGCSVIVRKSTLLKVCMNFSNTDEMIEIGSVEIRYIPSFVTLSGIDKNEMKISEENHFFTISESQKIEEVKPTLAELFSQKKRKTIF